MKKTLRNLDWKTPLSIFGVIVIAWWFLLLILTPAMIIRQDFFGLYIINRYNGQGTRYTFFSMKPFSLSLDTNGSDPMRIASFGIMSNARHTVFTYEEIDKQAAAGDTKIVSFNTATFQQEWNTEQPAN